MSLCKGGIAASVTLGMAFLLVGSVMADDKQPARAAQDDPRASGEIKPSEQDQPDDTQEVQKTVVKRLSGGQSSSVREQADEGSLPATGRKGAEKARRSRVHVRDLRARSAHTRDGRDGAQWGYPRGYPLYWPHARYYGYDPYRIHDSLIDVYRARRYIEQKERERRRNRRDMARREQRLLDRHEQALAAGLEQLKAGDAARATVAFTLAAKLNQGDPACRIHLAQARLAQGHYREATLALRRALELQPKLIYTDLHLQKYYQAEDALDTYTDTLSQWLRENRARPEVCFLLGFFEFQRGDFAAAHAAFDRARAATPDDDLTREYLEVTKPARE